VEQRGRGEWALRWDELVASAAASFAQRGEAERRPAEGERSRKGGLRLRNFSGAESWVAQLVESVDSEWSAAREALAGPGTEPIRKWLGWALYRLAARVNPEIVDR
jgi:hypothetical protein